MENCIKTAHLKLIQTPSLLLCSPTINSGIDRREEKTAEDYLKTTKWSKRKLEIQIYSCKKTIGLRFQHLLLSRVVVLAPDIMRQLLS
jgi:hypothetical protein